MGGAREQEKEEREVRNHAQETSGRGHRQRSKFDFGLLASDFISACMWVWSGPLIKILVHKGLGFKHDLTSEVVRYAFSIVNMFFFAILGKISRGASYNPLTVLAGAISGGFNRFLFTVGARIPAQVLGSIVGVRFLIAMIPEIGRGPKLAVDIHHGAIVEGILTFMIVSISLGLTRNLGGSFYRKTWISSLSKLALHILGADLTGGCMNPASVMGWAYARGDHITKEHLLVYWLAPVEATLLAVWASKLLFKGQIHKPVESRKKSD